MGATGDRGSVIVVFSGATIGYNEAIDQVRSLVMKGYRVQLVFSRGAETLYAKFLWEQLEGFPHLTPMEEPKSAPHFEGLLRSNCPNVEPQHAFQTGAAVG